MSFEGRSPRVRQDRLRRILPTRGDEGHAKAPSRGGAFSTCPQFIIKAIGKRQKPVAAMVQWKKEGMGFTGVPFYTVPMRRGHRGEGGLSFGCEGKPDPWEGAK